MRRDRHDPATVQVDLRVGGRIRIHVREFGSGVKARLAAYGMKWRYDAQLDKLDTLLSSPRTET